MKNRFHSIFLTSVASLSLLLSSCVKYISSYSALMMVRNETSHYSSLSFSSLTGRIVFKMNAKEGDALYYTYEVGEGSGNIYYDNGEDKTLLHNFTSNTSLNSKLEGLSQGFLYIIIETDGKCNNGSFTFEVE